tara:strand:+ start:295 stop:444 length:150 start_codon:yes stop_codon:yes gene_type:complete
MKVKRSLTPKIVQEVMKKEGVILNQAESEQLLDMIYKFSKLVVDQIVKK